MPNYEKDNRRISGLQERVAILEAKNGVLRENEIKLNNALYETLHEVRRFTSEIYNNSEQLAKRAAGKADETGKELAYTVFYTAGMLSARLNLTTLQLNPASAGRASTFKAGVYKKFEKAKYVLATKARSKRINVRFNGNSYLEISTIVAFELVPFLLLDNALKYSPAGMDINVTFVEVDESACIVKVDSVGPLVNPDELTKIFERGYRGVNSSEQSGEGLGLYLAKFLCDYHDIEIAAKSEPEKIAGVQKTPMGRFEIEMRVKI
ncbi:ATP-binding protein [Variovorax sp. RB3P1]|uniref:ATP-binding protein n=1 Tax=Variovorax sp. RB3P1 TaxID=3443732 RepID=UPI003F4749EF